MCAKPQFGRARQRLRMSLHGFWLHHGLRGGCAAREPEAVAGATPLFRCLASLRRQIGAHERHVASLRRAMARMTSAETREALQVETVRAEAELRSTRRAIGEYDLGQQVSGVRQEIERYDLDGKIRHIEGQIERYDLDGKIRGIEAEIGQYDLDGRIRAIEAQIEQYDLDGRTREIEAQIEEWDADRRAEEIERAMQDDVAALRRLIHAAEQRS